MMRISKHWKILAGVCALALPAAAQKDMDMEFAGFRAPEYDERGVMISQIFGDRAEMQGGGEWKITGLRVELYQDGKTAATVTSPYCFFDQKTREVHSDAPVAAVLDRLTMSGRGFLYKVTERSVHVLDESRVVVKDATMQMEGLSGIEMPGNAGTTNAGTTNTETVITSKELFLDYKSRSVRFEKDVHVQDPKMEMHCEELTIRVGEDNKIDWIGASTGVRIQSDGREAQAGKATYDVKTDTFLLEDNPRIVDGRNVLTGEQIRFWRASGRMICEPSARVVFYSDKALKTELFEK
jgi:lipopolysaccharide transport protein LptA